MRRIYWINDSIYSPLGIGSGVNFEQLCQRSSGIRLVHNRDLSEKPFYASIIPNVACKDGFTRFEQIAFQTAAATVLRYNFDRTRTLFVLSTTKGNISQLGEQTPIRLNLHESAQKIARALAIPNVITISNACISGVVALLIGQRFLATGKYAHALVVGAEELSKFVVSGFQSLYALSDSPCKPFDKNRSGITLGEAGAAVLLSTDPRSFKEEALIQIAGSGGTSNDANHISGPSRTGLELAQAIAATLHQGGLQPGNIDFVSAHGTATVYNDEMEAKAFHAAKLDQTPVHSLKGYFGHTLGAAGVIESIIAKECLVKNTLLESLGFAESGVSEPINVVRKTERKNLRSALKTASGFGGCNAALALLKLD